MLLVYRIINKLRCLTFRWLFGKFFGSFGRNSSVLAPVGIEGIGNIHIGNDVYISNGALLAAVPHTGATECRLHIGDGVSLGRYNHVYATGSILIEANVLTANNVYIADNSHGYAEVSRAVKHQPILQKKPVLIGAGSWLGQNVCVLGASVGKGCVIGANSVVVHDIPDHCVAVGSPARIIKRYDPATARWQAVSAAS